MPTLNFDKPYKFQKPISMLGFSRAQANSLSHWIKTLVLLYRFFVQAFKTIYRTLTVLGDLSPL